MSKKVVLAFSGGLDTSYCVKYLSQEKGLTVYSAIVNTGGFSQEELEGISQKAQKLGVASHVTLDVTQTYYQDCLRYLVFGNVLRNGTYPLSVSSERLFQAMAIANYAKKIEADYIAHGSTGAGNDQVRFDLVFQVVCPGIEILTPIRDQQLSREAEIDYLKAQGVEDNWEKAQYSINKGLWGTSVGGKETLTSEQPLPEEAYPTPQRKQTPEKISLSFEKGELKGINDTNYHDSVGAIRALEAIAAPFGIGRDIHVGDTIIGIKGRVGFEAAAPMLIIKAHQQLEKHCLSKWQQHWKTQLADWYGMLLHEGQYLEPLMRNIERFLEDTQARVTGKVFLQLHPYRFEILGTESAYDLMNSNFGHYGEMNRAWSGEDVKGFTKILANSLKIYYQYQNEGEEGISND